MVVNVNLNINLNELQIETLESFRAESIELSKIYNDPTGEKDAREASLSELVEQLITFHYFHNKSEEEMRDINV